MNYHPNERRYLAEELIAERGRSYAAVLGNMAGMAIRAEGLTGARQKTAKSTVAGMRLALALILKVEHDMTETDAERAVKVDEQRWREATAKDEASIESAE
ncbi:hypothetical protein [Streptomyces roseolus]|uniref:hypothetical protein n=1 Tax=Streptomyces roseolus TaxID=67358 RepID=UPI001675AB9E|nr:hypothetical protein [Streptomyces roseolus]GGR57277.1 hypothetical protein GCM10010282_57800 [Streptomyces roseolus]